MGAEERKQFFSDEEVFKSVCKLHKTSSRRWQKGRTIKAIFVAIPYISWEDVSFIIRAAVA